MHHHSAHHASSPLLDFSQVSVEYDGVLVLDKVNWQVSAGSLVGILGGNGSGKTTLMKALLGLWPYTGSITFAGAPLDNFTRAQHMAYVPQFFGVDRSFPITVKEVLDLELAASHSYTGITSIPQDMLRVFGVDTLLKTRLSQLSGGQLQRVLLTRALVSQPDVLIFDEPTNNLDVASVRAFYKLLAHLHDQGVTVIIVTHDHEFLHEVHGKGLLFEVAGGKIKPHVHT